jgi:hypothetical protein
VRRVAARAVGLAHDHRRQHMRRGQHRDAGVGRVVVDKQPWASAAQSRGGRG